MSIIKDLKIENAEIDKDILKYNRLAIVFKIEDREFLLHTSKIKGSYYPVEISHLSNEKCPHCFSKRNVRVSCRVLNEHIDEILERIKIIPNIKLRLLKYKL